MVQNTFEKEQSVKGYTSEDILADPYEYWIETGFTGLDKKTFINELNEAEHPFLIVYGIEAEADPRILEYRAKVAADSIKRLLLNGSNNLEGIGFSGGTRDVAGNTEASILFNNFDAELSLNFVETETSQVLPYKKFIPTNLPNNKLIVYVDEDPRSTYTNALGFIDIHRRENINVSDLFIIAGERRPNATRAAISTAQAFRDYTESTGNNSLLPIKIYVTTENALLPTAMENYYQEGFSGALKSSRELETVLTIATIVNGASWVDSLTTRRIKK